MVDRPTKWNVYSPMRHFTRKHTEWISNVQVNWVNGLGETRPQQCSVVYTDLSIYMSSICLVKCVDNLPILDTRCQFIDKLKSFFVLTDFITRPIDFTTDRKYVFVIVKDFKPFLASECRTTCKIVFVTNEACVGWYSVSKGQNCSFYIAFVAFSIYFSFIQQFRTFVSF